MYFIGIDIGTSRIKAGIINATGDVIYSSYRETGLRSTGPGRMEHEPDKIYSDALEIIKEILDRSKISPDKIEAIGIDGQMGGVIGIDKNFNSVTGLDTYLDIRSERYNDFIHKKYNKQLREITCGSPLNFQKIIWWKKNKPEKYKKVLKFITINSYVSGKLAGNKGDRACIDHTLISFFGVEDLLKLNWSEDLCKLFGLEINKLPDIKPPWEIIGGISKISSEKCGLLKGTPIVTGAGDQPAGLLGAGLLNKGEIIDVSGSTNLLILVVDKFIPDIKNGVVMYMPSIIKGIYYAFIYVKGGGVCLQWFRDQFLLDEKTENEYIKKSKYEIIEEKAKKIPPGSDGLIFIPHFGGRQCPYSGSMKGAWIGLNWGHRKEHMYRAILESIAYEYNIGLSSIIRLFKDYKIENIMVTGGGSKSKLWNKIKADVLGMPYFIMESYQFALRGSGLIAAYGVGAISDLENVASKSNIISYKNKYMPDKKNNKIYNSYIKIYKDIFKKPLGKTSDRLSELID